VPDADAEQQPARELAREFGVLPRERGGLVLPNVHDSRRDGQTLGDVEQGAHGGQPRRPAQPERPET
jgi:hypothetical protein